LQSDDFFNTATYPKMTFVSKSFKKMANDQYALTGDLTIRDITKEVTLDVKYGGNIQDPYGNTKAGFKATGAINRFDYGLKWNALTEAGGAVASEEVALTLNLEFKLAK
jgi:polyisoprenoid-binding protein YceI